jgi:hypothetical protein
MGILDGTRSDGRGPAAGDARAGTDALVRELDEISEAETEALLRAELDAIDGVGAK